jgi:hypothetical protein
MTRGFDFGKFSRLLIAGHCNTAMACSQAPSGPMKRTPLFSNSVLSHGKSFSSLWVVCAEIFFLRWVALK